LYLAQKEAKMFRLLEMIVSTMTTARAEQARAPWTCSECGYECPSDGSRRHMITHRALTLSADPLVVELRCYPAKENLAVALLELRTRWPGRKFTLLPSSYGRTAISDGMELFSVLAVAE
jgi:hypothetical protein